jgi:hypothetical protein
MHLDSESSIKVTTEDNNAITDNMVPNGHDRMAHLTSKISIWQTYLSLPPQHPVHFIGLCAQVFFYYLAYGYLQVSFV